MMIFEKVVHCLMREDHYTILNLGHEGRVEFRGGDGGGLEMGHIQAQVAMAANMSQPWQSTYHNSSY